MTEPPSAGPSTGPGAVAGPGVGAAAARWRVLVRGLCVEAEIGLLPQEQGVLQPLRVDVEVDLDSGAVVTLADSVDYGGVAEDVRALAAAGPWRLVEHLAQRIAARVLLRPNACGVTVRVLKTARLPDAEAAGCELRLVRPPVAPPVAPRVAP